MYTQKTESPAGTPCLFSLARGEVPNCVYTKFNGRRFISPRYLKALSFDRYGLATVRVDDGWMYVDRHGNALITGVPTVDNGPDYFRDGLVRFVKDEKYGFADRKGRIVIQPIYDGAMPFEEGKAKVCQGCVIKRTGEYQFFSGGRWILLDTKGATKKVAPQRK